MCCLSHLNSTLFLNTNGFNKLEVWEKIHIQSNQASFLLKIEFSVLLSRYLKTHKLPSRLITIFPGLCGFRPLSQIQANLKAVPQLTEAIGKDLVEALLKSTKDNYGPALKNVFTALMNCPKDALNKSLTSLKSEIDKKTCLTGTERLFQRLWYDFPGDVGCFVIYFLNLLVLKPGKKFQNEFLDLSFCE